MATHSSTLAWRIPTDRGAWQELQPIRVAESETNKRLSTSRKRIAIIQSEVSQKDKDQYSILTHIYGI